MDLIELMNKNTLKTVLGILFGNTVLAFVVVAFVLPSGLVMGGATVSCICLSSFLTFHNKSSILVII